MKTRRMNYVTQVRSKKTNSRKIQKNSIEELLKLCQPVRVCLTRSATPKKNCNESQLKSNNMVPKSPPQMCLPLLDKPMQLRSSRRNKSSRPVEEKHSITQETTSSAPLKNVLEDQDSASKYRLEPRSSSKAGILRSTSSQKIQRIGKTTTVPTLQSTIDSTFKKEATKNSGKKFAIGDIVMAKMAGYCAWPARVDGFSKNGRRMICFFYGSHNSGCVDIDQAIPFSNAFETIKLINMRNPRDFAKGVREVELQHGVPEQFSVLKED